MSPISTRICVPNVVAVRRSCRKKGGTDRQTDKGKLQLYIIDSVVTCRQITINSSASAPVNAKKIAVKKVSDVDVGMFGLEL